MLILSGKLHKEELSKKKPGSDYQVKLIAVDEGGLGVTIVEAPVDYKVPVDKEGNVSLPVGQSAKTWDNVAKRFQYVQVKNYIKK